MKRASHFGPARRERRRYKSVLPFVDWYGDRLANDFRFRFALGHLYLLQVLSPIAVRATIRLARATRRGSGS